ncbi:RagB/SusD family nutrient uptake outer membrane protein [Dawidia soli]|uniref:RagB/SusD family nutrient uptake outer membrane protein n=1 Tax=Dawidia soli TaxID=2782352 RepID=A0AAP2DCJ0_9BACT|nr:RagB/SusD family nutrient uptake outer membrane protein [Dawidia soli]MBT1689248.1 RagB/SusD family nutrient uptake outer membrane protein [Dawidia soli]
MKTETRCSQVKPLSRILMLAVIVVLSACVDFVQVGNPRTEVTSRVVYQDDATATAAVLGIYSEMASSPVFTSVSLAMFTGLSSDEFVAYYDEFRGFEQNSLTPGVARLRSDFWLPAYKYIYYANAVIEGLRDNTAISPRVDSLLTGEAYFIRAFCNFHLTNLFGPLPLVNTTDFRINEFLPRVPQDEVYALIEQDLLIARAYLPSDFSAGKGERIRATTWAASALLARLYLYRQRWAEAEAEATRLLEASGGLFSLPPVAEAFLFSSPEAIWQLKPWPAGAFEATHFLIPEGAFYSDVSLRTDMLRIHGENDSRRQWRQYTVTPDGDTLVYPYKYTSPYEPMEYHIEFRLAEQYLIRAEARAQQENLEGALADVDAIRDRAGIEHLQDNGTAWTQPLVLDSILAERRRELFTEGHRWFDLLRTGQAKAVLEVLDGKDWQDTDALYPVPESEIKNNPNLEPQNDGY